jgi:hypothetical protein
MNCRTSTSIEMQSPASTLISTTVFRSLSLDRLFGPLCNLVVASVTCLPRRVSALSLSGTAPGKGWIRPPERLRRAVP